MKEVVIVPDEDNKSFDKGAFFENLANIIFSSQRYKVSGNVHYTGMEFDLECEHLDRVGEIALVECKARLSLSTTDIRNFCFNVDFKGLSYGYFLYTRNYERQVAGLISEIKKKSKYKNIYFWNAEKFIELLIAVREVKSCTPDFSDCDLEVSKEILFYSYLGIYYVLLLSNSTIPTCYCVFNARTLESVYDQKLINHLCSYIKDIDGLNFYEYSSQTSNIDSDYILDTVVEIQESESWDDYKPASSKYFVGRKRVKEDIFSFLQNILKGESKKRTFYVYGKSGWGKSSLLNELRARFRNKHYRKKYFAFVVDSRSAHSQNFVGMSFCKLLENAAKEKFIPKKYERASVLSAYNVIDSKEIEELQDYLKVHNRLLVIVFDQFEDVFRKGNIFESFYSLLMSVNGSSGNIILGFSWKSEINIPIDHKAYHLWQQARDYAYSIEIDEFDYSESRAIVEQLEEALDQKLDNDFKRKIIQTSQGFPWWVKKLCIHISKEFVAGVSIEDLYNQDFNVEPLFKSDLEDLHSDEVRAIRYIAQRAYDNDAFDYTEIDEVIKNDVISNLLHKRFVIKSGTKYNIYWDIFRDYLVLDKVPKIGETYLIRSPVKSVLDAFLCFFSREPLSLMASNIFYTK